MSRVEEALKTLDHQVNGTVWGDGACRVSRESIRILIADHARLKNALAFQAGCESCVNAKNCDEAGGDPRNCKSWEITEGPHV